MTHLAEALAAYGWEAPRQQQAMVRLLAFCGQGKRLGLAEDSLRIGPHQARALLQQGGLFDSAAEAVSWLRDATQAAFYTGHDYASLASDAGFHGENRHEILPLLEQLGMTDSRVPARKEYDIALLPGGTEPWSRIRLEHLGALAEDGLRMGEVVLLGSSRLLMPEVEEHAVLRLLEAELESAGRPMPHAALRGLLKEAVNDPVLQDITDIYARNTAQAKKMLEALELDFPHWPTEARMLELLYADMQRVHPVLRDTPARTIRSPMISRKDGRAEPENTADTVQALLLGELRRANTQDTFLDFMDSMEGRQGATVVSVSHQPYALHQHGQLMASLPEEAFPLRETVAPPAAREDVNVHHALGCVAKYIYARHEQVRAQVAEQQPAMAR